MVWEGNKPNTLPRVEDDRLAELAEDRTGWNAIQGPRAMTDLETLAILDELRAWRKYKLTNEEKGTLAAIRCGIEQDGNNWPVSSAQTQRAIAVLEKMCGGKS